jgi:hypothetical protein
MATPYMWLFTDLKAPLNPSRLLFGQWTLIENVVFPLNWHLLRFNKHFAELRKGYRNWHSSKKVNPNNLPSLQAANYHHNRDFV